MHEGGEGPGREALAGMSDGFCWLVVNICSCFTIVYEKFIIFEISEAISSKNEKKLIYLICLNLDSL